MASLEKDRKADQHIIKESYFRLVIINIIVLMASTMSGLVDNLVISRELGEEALAAVGFFAPVLALVGIGYVIVMGAAVLCGNYIGAGQQKKVSALFNSAVRVLTGFYLVFALILVFGRVPLATLLGARGVANELLRAYMAGYGPSVLFTMVAALLLSLASFNNELTRSYISAALLFVASIVFDLVLVKPLGIFGIGLATTLSNAIPVAVLLPVFLKKEATVHFEKGRTDLKLVGEAAKRGMPALFFTAGMLIKNSLLNYSLAVSAGDAAIAVVNVMGSVCGIGGTFSGGFVNAYSVLGSLYYGEEDRGGFVDLFCTSILYGTIFLTAAAAGIAFASKPLAGIFFAPGTDIWQMGQRMFLLGFWFLPLTFIFNLLINSYKIQDRMTLANILSLLEPGLCGVFALLAVPGFGTDAAWLTCTWSDVVMIGIVLISVFVWKKKVTFRPEDILKLPDDFGAAEDEYEEFNVTRREQVSEISEEVWNFCKERGVDEKKAYWASLCVEEVTRNIFDFGTPGKMFFAIDVRVVCKDELTIRFQDNCRKFDPCDYMKMMHPDSPEQNIGLRMVSKVASYMDYFNNAGINTLILKI